MVNQRVNGDRTHGGIAVRDYTRDGRALKTVWFKKINIDQVARALIWASLGLGLAEVIMPRRVQKVVGIKKGDYSTIIRLAGLREIMHAMLIFVQARPFSGVWSRVVGDAMDIGLLGAAFTAPKTQKGRLGVATASILGVTAIDAVTAAQMTRKRASAEALSAITQSQLDGRTANGGFRVFRSITINSSPNELYQFWRNFENLPRFMYHLEDVRVLDQRRSHWVAKAPAGQTVEWDAEITEDRPNELIAWRSSMDAQVPNSGTVRFEPGPAGRGTVVRVEIEYRPPAGPLGKLVARLFGEEPAQQVVADLARFKQMIEVGEIVRSDGVPEGVGTKMQRVAQPMPGDPGQPITYREIQEQTTQR